MLGFVVRNCRLAVLVVVLCSGMSAAAVAQSVVRAAEVPVLTEGPTVARDGTVYFTEMRSERILRLGTDGEVSVYREQSFAANGLVIDLEGRLIACEGGADGQPARITRTDLSSGVVEVLADNYQGTPFSRPNDVTIDGRGRLYFTDPAASAVYRVDAPGQVTRVLASPDIERPNGLQISPDDATLYIIESGAAPVGPRMVRAFDLQLDGSATSGRVLFNFPGRSADGMRAIFMSPPG
jgi:gluconolactonase